MNKTNQKKVEVNLETVHKIADAIDKLMTTEFKDSTPIEAVAAFIEFIGSRYVIGLKDRGLITYTPSEHSSDA